MFFTQIKDFVKHNTDEGFVEIKLHEPAGRDPTIKRVMSATNNSSTYFINGRPAKAIEVREGGRERGRLREGERREEKRGKIMYLVSAQAKELVEKMNVQLGNHCQFLPQVSLISVLHLNEQAAAFTHVVGRLYVY